MAIQDFTTWTEADPSGVITVAESSITLTNMERRDDGCVYKDYGAAHFSGDFTFKYELTVSNSDVSSWIYPLALVNTANEMGDEINANSHDAQGSMVINSAGNIRCNVFVEESGSLTTSYIDDGGEVYLAEDTKYYVTITRDNGGGANNTGQLAIYVCTGNYYGEGGASLYGSTTVDCSAGEQNDFQYVQTCFPRGNTTGTEATDCLFENFNDGEGATYRDVAFTIAATSGFSITANQFSYKDVAFTIAGTSTTSFAAEMIGGDVENYETNQTRRLVVAGNDCIYYESN